MDVSIHLLENIQAKQDLGTNTTTPGI